MDERFVVFIIGVMLHYRCGLGSTGTAVPAHVNSRDSPPPTLPREPESNNDR
jgi:hypothetical protein